MKSALRADVFARTFARMPSEPIQFYHRYKKIIETEKVFGERWLRFAYENPVGKFFVWLLATDCERCR